MHIKALVAKEILIHVKGTGATGSIKIKNVVGPQYKMTVAKKVPPKSEKPTATQKSTRKAPAAKKVAKSPKKVVKKAPSQECSSKEG